MLCLELSRRTSPGGGSYSGYFGEATVDDIVAFTLYIHL